MKSRSKLIGGSRHEMTNARILNAERVARKKATHDAESYNRGLDDLNAKIKEHWLFRGSDGKVYREIIDDLVKELRK